MALGSDGGSMLPTQCRKGLCRAVSDLTFAERPGRDVVAAEAELGVWIVSGHGLLLAWPEVRAVPPHAMQNDGELSGLLCGRGRNHTLSGPTVFAGK